MLGKLSDKFTRITLINRFSFVQSFLNNCKQLKIVKKTWFQTLQSLQTVKFAQAHENRPDLVSVLRLSLLYFLLKLYGLKILSDEHMSMLLESNIFQVELNSHRVHLTKLKTIYEFVLNQVFIIYKSKQPSSI